MAPHIPAPTTQPLEHSSESACVRGEFASYGSQTQLCMCKFHKVSMGWNAFLSLELFSARIEAREYTYVSIVCQNIDGVVVAFF